MSETGGNPRDATAVRAASRIAALRSHSRKPRPPQERKSSGSLVLTAFVVIAILFGMLWLMLSLN